jgi:predicted metal-dependent phosphoesterase TrpH
MIFLSEDSYIPNIYVDYLFSPTWDECVKVIRDAGGLSFLAHYFSISKKVNLPFIEKLIEEGRLDGVEVVYGMDMMTTEIREQQEELEKIAEMTGCLVSGGSDAHTYENWIDFVNSKEFASRTVGLLGNILKNSNKELEWYNRK